MKYLFQIIGVIIMGKFCSGCGMELEEGAKFCPTCGTKVESASLAVPSAQTVATDITETQPQNVPVNPVVQAQTFQPSETTNFVASDYAYSIPESRNFVKTLLLSVVTLGIYGIYWFYMFTEDIHTLVKRKTTPNYLIVILLSIVTLGIYGCYYMYKITASLNEAKDQRQMGGMRRSPWLIVLLVIIPYVNIVGGLVAWYWLVESFNEIVEYDRRLSVR